MENLTAAQFHHKLPPPPLWNSNTRFLTSFTSKPNLISTSSLPRSLPPSLDCSVEDPPQSTSLLSDIHHHHHRFLNSLPRRLSHHSPLRLLQEDGDWSKDRFFTVIRFLRHSSRLHEILPVKFQNFIFLYIIFKKIKNLFSSNSSCKISKSHLSLYIFKKIKKIKNHVSSSLLIQSQVFDAWKKLDPSRINEANYEKIIRLLCAERSMEEAVLALQSMTDDYKLNPSLEIYNSIIHGYADDGHFEEAMLFLNGMKDNGVLPETETYDGLIEGYGKCQMYDEIVSCVKRMEAEGCARDHVTYNLLVREFARGGLLKRMERMYQSLMSRKMTLEPVTLVSMLEAYAEFGVLEKMEETYGKILRFGICLDEELVRRLACVYIDKLMFSRLDDLGRGIRRRSDLAWCLRGLCQACLVSRKGLDYVVKEMEEARVPWSTTFANIVLLGYWKMGDFKSIERLLFELGKRRVKLDLVTVGIVFDSSVAGFDGTAVFMRWKKSGFLDKPVEMKTDPLVHAAFGEGQFLRSCNEVMKHTLEESKSWTYQYLLEVVVNNQKTEP